MTKKRKRESISKKTRFEVFKRDKFTCQYCGAKAPDVILHLDHIKPVAKGGKVTLVNLLTACENCNQGKSAILLGDDSAVKKAQKQAESLQDRREQLEMIMQWHEDLGDIDNEIIKKLTQFWYCLLGNHYSLTESGIKKLRKMVKRFSLDETLTAMKISAENYIVLDVNNKPTPESAELAFNKISGICVIRRLQKDDPDIQELYYIRGILRNRLSYFDQNIGLMLLKKAHAVGATTESLKKFATEVYNWTEFKNAIEEFINKNG